MYTHITMLIDESASMGHLKNTVLESIQGLINKQKLIDEPCTITIATFNSSAVSNSFALKSTRMGKIQEAVFNSYHPSGGTPLLEAMCLEIDHTGADLAALPEDKRPQKVIFVIMTDGEENTSSREYTINDVRRRIKMQSDVYKWEFLFLGANIDAFAVGMSYGFTTANISQYNATNKGYTASTTILESKLSGVRTGNLTSTAFTPSEQTYLNQTK